MNREDDALVRSQSDAAAAEAGAIGGDPGLVEEEDPAQAPVIEAGGGVAEGVEQAEGALVDNAVNPDNPGHPRHHAFTPEQESDRSGAAYGQADEVASTEHEGNREDAAPDRRDSRSGR